MIIIYTPSSVLAQNQTIYLEPGQQRVLGTGYDNSPVLYVRNVQLKGNSNPDVADVVVLGVQYRVTAKKEGMTLATISYETVSNAGGAVTPGTIVYQIVVRKQGAEPAANNSPQELKPPPGEGQRVCVAVGQRNDAAVPYTNVQFYVDTAPKDVAQVYLSGGTGGVYARAYFVGQKPGTAVVRVSHREFLAGLGKYQDVNNWFYVTVTEKPTDDAGLCGGSGEPKTSGVNAPQPPNGSNINNGAGSGNNTSVISAGGSNTVTTGPGSSGNVGASKPAASNRVSPGVVSTSSNGVRASGTPTGRANSTGGGMSRPATKTPPTENKETAAAANSDTVHERVFVNAGKSRTASFKAQVSGVKVESSDRSVATGQYREGYGVTIKGIKAGKATITVRDEKVRYVAGDNALQQNQPQTYIFDVEVLPSNKKATPDGKVISTFDDDVIIYAGTTFTERYNKKAVTDLQASASNQSAVTLDVVNNELRIRGTRKGKATVTAKGKIIDEETGAPGTKPLRVENPFVSTINVTVVCKPFTRGNLSVEDAVKELQGYLNEWDEVQTSVHLRYAYSRDGEDWVRKLFAAAGVKYSDNYYGVWNSLTTNYRDVTIEYLFLPMKNALRDTIYYLKDRTIVYKEDMDYMRRQMRDWRARKDQIFALYEQTYQALLAEAKVDQLTPVRNDADKKARDDKSKEYQDEAYGYLKEVRPIADQPVLPLKTLHDACR
jgi:hypothetical protein